MTYPGDSKLSEDIRQRVQSTFEQSSELARQGKVQEASLGCEFILRLDPLFEPARELMRRIQAGEAEPVPATPEADSEAEGEAESAEEPADESQVDLSGEFADLLDRRDFRTLLNLAEEHSGRVAASSGLQEMVEAAATRLEAEPYVRAFLEAAEKAQRKGRDEVAAAEVEKARALDPSHPGLPAAARTPQGDESNDRIAELLAEGQSALERGDHQGAIDSWSRIFLIDIDHAEASARIEEARRLKAESERQIEEAYHEGVSLWELGTTDKAREQFEKVLEIAPSHPGATDYLRRMKAQEPPPDLPDLGGATATGDAEIFAPPDPDATLDAPPEAEPSAEEDLDFDDFDEEELAAPEPAPAAGAKTSARIGSIFSNRRFLAVAGLGVVALLVAFGWLYLRRDDYFPNSDAAAPAARAVDALARARALHEAGQTTMAIGQLRGLPTDHPQYAEARALIAQWEAPQPAETAEPAVPAEVELEQRDRLVELGHEARRSREYLAASRFYARAEEIAPLDEEDQLLRTEVEERLEGLETQIELFEQGDWEFVLPDLWRLHSANPDDRDIVRLMVDSYYNLGVRDLQRGDMAAAEEKLTRAAELEPADGGVARLLRFSQVYKERPADLLHRIFVKYLPFR